MDGDEIQECRENTAHAEVRGTGSCLCGYRKYLVVEESCVDGELVEEQVQWETGMTVLAPGQLTMQARRLEEGLTLQSSPVLSRNGIDQYMDARGLELRWSKYAEDGTLRLFKEGSMLSDDTAGYNDPRVNVKILVRQRGGSAFLAIIPVTRAALDLPGSLEALAWAANPDG